MNEPAQVSAMSMAQVSMVSPQPTDHEAAAIVAAVEMLWPSAHVVEQPDTDRSANWRFSGRWWRRDRMADASRPWT